MAKYRTTSRWRYLKEDRYVEVGEELELPKQLGNKMISKRCVEEVAESAEGNGSVAKANNEAATQAETVTEQTPAGKKTKGKG